MMMMTFCGTPYTTDSPRPHAFAMLIFNFFLHAVGNDPEAGTDAIR